MSWSVSASGLPTEVKETLAKQFDNARRNTVNFPTENSMIVLAEAQVALALDQMIKSDFPSVTISGYGSSTETRSEHNWKGSTQYSLTITPVNVVSE